MLAQLLQLKPTPGLPRALTGLAGRISFDARKLEVRELRGAFGDAQVHFEGAIAAAGGTTIAADTVQVRVLRASREKGEGQILVDLAKLRQGSEDVPVQVLVAKLALGIVAPAQFDEFGHLLVNTLEFRRRSCE